MSLRSFEIATLVYKRPRTYPTSLCTPSFSCKCHYLGVEPRGVEPLTSAVQRQLHQFTSVHYSSRIRLHRAFLPSVYRDEPLCTFLHWCTTSVNGTVRIGHTFRDNLPAQTSQSALAE